MQLRLLMVMCFVLASVFCAPAGDSSGTAEGDYDDLVQLFQDFRELQKPKMTDWVPDYTPAAIEAQRSGLLEYQRRLAAMDISSWTTEQKVEYHLVRAEMNGLDFYQRVLKPWSRDPVYYMQTQAGGGPVRYNALRINEIPIPDDELEEVQGKLQAVPIILGQAKSNLTEGAADLLIIALHYMDAEITFHRRLRDAIAEHHPELLQDAQQALAAVIEYGEWLKDNQSTMTAQAGVGKENYNWWMKNVQLVPYTWDELYGIIMREDDRILTTVALERNRNRHLPELQPVPTQAEHRRRRDQALRFAMEFMQEQQLFDIPDWLDIEGYLRRSPLAGFSGSGDSGSWPGIRDYFHQTGDREPLPEQTHEFIGHYFDSKRQSLDTSPIRGTERFYAIDMIRMEGWAFWLEEMMMHAGYLDTRPTRGREIAYWQAAFRTCRAIADLKMHNNDFTLRQAIDYCVTCAPNGWLLPDGPHVWYEMQTNLRFVGWHLGMVFGKFQLNNLIAERTRQMGNDFNYKDFFEEFFAAGIIPISLIRWQMTGLDDEMKILLED